MLEKWLNDDIWLFVGAIIDSYDIKIIIRCDKDVKESWKWGVRDLFK